MAALFPVSDATFASGVEHAEGLVLVDFAAAWCAPCRAVHPIVQQLAAGYGGRLKVVTVDVDANPRTAARFGIRNLPALLFMRAGRVVDQPVGALPRSAIQARIDLNFARCLNFGGDAARSAGFWSTRAGAVLRVCAPAGARRGETWTEL